MRIAMFTLAGLLLAGPAWGQSIDQLQNATLVVIGFTVAISLVIWIMDSVVRLVVAQIMGIFGA